MNTDPVTPTEQPDEDTPAPEEVEQGAYQGDRADEPVDTEEPKVA